MSDFPSWLDFARAVAGALESGADTTDLTVQLDADGTTRLVETRVPSPLAPFPVVPMARVINRDTERAPRLRVGFASRGRLWWWKCPRCHTIGGDVAAYGFTNPANAADNAVDHRLSPTCGHWRRHNNQLCILDALANPDDPPSCQETP